MQLESKQWNVTLDEDDFLDLVDTAGYGIGYWAFSGAVDSKWNTYTVKYFDDGERKEVVISIWMIESAIEKILNGEVQCGYDIRKYIREDDIDAEVADVIIQVAAFGEVVYG